MRFVSTIARLFVLGCLLLSCSSTGNTAEVVPPPPPVPRSATATELEGVWLATRPYGGLEEVARAFTYAFDRNGTYTAAVLVDNETGVEWITVAGHWTLIEGYLDLGEDTPRFKATITGSELCLESQAGGLLLAPLFGMTTSETPAGNPLR